MLTRDSYIALLEKRAADAAESAIEPTDSAELTTQEFHRNREDDRQYLHGIFPNAGEVQSAQSASVKKLFNNIPSGAIVGSPLLKVARAIFDNALAEGSIKTASPIHAELSYRAFVDELEKIGMTMGMGATPSTAPAMAPMSGGLKSSPGATSAPLSKLSALQSQNLAQVAAKNRVAMSRPQKAWNISGGSPVSAGAAGARPAQGSGTSVAQPGLLSKLLGR